MSYTSVHTGLEIDEGITQAQKIGNLTTLTTTEKSNLVGAINEVDADLGAHKADIVSQVGGVHGLIEERGVWTPKLEATIVNGIHTYSTQVGSYYRIGKLVHCFFDIKLSAKDATMDGNTVIAGLPFVPLPGIGSVALNLFSAFTLTAGYTYISASIGSRCTLFQSSPTSIESGIPASAATNTTRLRGSIIYEIA